MTENVTPRSPLATDLRAYLREQIIDKIVSETNTNSRTESIARYTVVMICTAMVMRCPITDVTDEDISAVNTLVYNEDPITLPENPQAYDDFFRPLDSYLRAHGIEASAGLVCGLSILLYRMHKKMKDQPTET